MTLCAALVLLPIQLGAAPYADIVLDARTGQVLHETNADARLHPASLTKMLTLYIAFEAIKRGEISLDSEVTISENAAAEAPSKLGLRPGQKIKLRYLIRGAAIKSANDAATAIGEAIGGSEAAFARRMNRTAKALGMTHSQFKNANGLTEEGHYSSARDMANLGRHLFYDHPEFYNLFSRRTADAGVKVVVNTNSRFLDGYPGADGIKTGYTVAAGFNLVSSAERDGVRIIGAVFGGLSTAERTAKMTEIMDIGFDKAPKTARTKRPKQPSYADVEDSSALVADAGETGDELADSIAESVAAQGVAAGKVITIMAAPTSSPIPRPRPSLTLLTDANNVPARVPDAAEIALAEATNAMQAQIDSAVAEAAVADATDEAAAPIVSDLAAYHPQARPASVAPAPEPAAETLVAAAPEAQPEAAAETVVIAAAEPEPAPANIDEAAAVAEQVAMTTEAAPAGEASDLAAKTVTVTPETFDVALADPVVISRLSTSGGRHWAINVGSYNSSYDAEKMLLRTALQEIGTLDEALRKVVKTKRGYDANFVGLTEDMAELACRRLSARSVPCATLGPNG